MIGLIVIALTTEFGFRLASGLIKTSLYRRTDRQLSAPRAILCLGDSFTQGVGAATGYDWPTQLSVLIDRLTGPGEWDVVNWGVAGQNSSQVRERGESFVAEYPDRAKIVVFAAGLNNQYNFQNAPMLPPELAEGSRAMKADYLLRNVRVYHFGRRSVELLTQVKQLEDAGKAEPTQALLSVEEAAERDFLAKWIQQDIALLRRQLREHNVKIALLNYWFGCPWIDRAYAAVPPGDDLLVIDVSRFGLDVPFDMLAERFANGDDRHPNLYGYARMAEIVFTDLRRAGWLEIDG